MADRVTSVRTKKSDGTFDTAIPIGAKAQNITMADGTTVQNKIGTTDISGVGTDITNAISQLNQKNPHILSREKITDLNNISDGWHQYDDPLLEVSNCPDNTSGPPSGGLLQSSNNANTGSKIQMLIRYMGQVVYIRSKWYSNNWTPWRKIFAGTSQTTVTPSNGITVAQNRVYKTGNLVQLTFWITNAASLTGETTIGTIPAGYRPLAATYCPYGCTNRTTGNDSSNYAVVAPGGGIVINASRKSSQYMIHVVYMVNL